MLAEGMCMVPAPLPPDEGERLEALRRYAVLDTPSEDAFDRIARLAARLLDVPIVLLALVDAERCFFKARLGLDRAEVPRSQAFSAHAILDDAVLLVENAALDPRFAMGPLVAGPSAIRFCAAAPLRTPEGRRVGALCALDRTPRRLPPALVEALADLAALAVDRLEQRRQAEERGRTEAILRAALDSLPLEFWARDREHRCILQNPVARTRRGDLIGTLPDDPGLPPETAAARLADGRRALAGDTVRGEVVETVGGAPTILDKIVAPVRAADGTVLGYLGVNLDVTEQRRTKAALAASEAAANAAAERTALALAAGRMGTWDWDVRNDRLVWDEQECRLFGLKPETAPTTGEAFLALVHPADRGMLLEAGRRAERTGQGFDGEYRILLPDGTVRWFAERCVAIRDANGRLVRMTGVNYDVTERKLVERRVKALAMRDPLTGLPNRRTLREVLARELARVGRTEDGRTGGGPALLLIDLDQFKRVNDTLGHPAGDTMLIEATRRLRNCVREGDMVARLGGDEFAVVAMDAHGPQDLAVLAGRLVAALALPFEIAGVKVAGGGSIGISIPAAGTGETGMAETGAGTPAVDGADDLLARADLALYAAKEAGRGTWRFFSPAMQAEAREAAALDRDLRRALEAGEFVLHYQPVVQNRGSRPAGPRSAASLAASRARADRARRVSHGGGARPAHRAAHLLDPRRGPAPGGGLADGGREPAAGRRQRRRLGPRDR